MVGRNEIDRIFGTDVYDSDGGKIGEAGQVYVDDETDEPEWVTVRTGLFGARESFVPLADAYFSEHGLTVPFDKTFIKNAPNQDVDGHLTPEEERDLYAYYGSGGGGEEGSRPDTDLDSEHDDDGPATAPLDRGDPVRRNQDAAVGEHSDTTDHRDRSGLTPDDTGTTPERPTDVGTEQGGTGQLRLRKVVVTENVTVTVPVQREEVRIEQDPIDDGGINEEPLTRPTQGTTGRDGGPAPTNEGDGR